MLIASTPLSIININDKDIAQVIFFIAYSRSGTNPGLLFVVMFRDFIMPKFALLLVEKEPEKGLLSKFRPLFLQKNLTVFMSKRAHTL